MSLSPEEFRQRALMRLEWVLESLECDDDYCFEANDKERVMMLARDLMEAIESTSIVPQPRKNHIL